MVTRGASIQVYDSDLGSFSFLTDSEGSNVRVVSNGVEVNFACLAAVAEEEFVFTGGSEAKREAYKINLRERSVNNSID